MNLLFTSVGRRTYLLRYFRKALESGDKIYAANSSALSPAFLEADESVVTPVIYDPAYIPFLVDYCRQKKITALIPLFDIDIPVLAQHKDEFREAGTHVITAGAAFAEICNDKWETFAFLRKNGFMAPETFVRLEDAKMALRAGVVNYPLMVKPRWGMGSIGVFQADNERELDVFYEKTRSAVINSYLKYESAQDLDECVLIQEMIDGQEYGLDVMNDLDGQYQNTVVKKKLAMRSGETDCAVTVDEPDVKEIGHKIAELSRHEGNLDVDCFRAKDGTIYVLEMNARFGGGYPFSHLAGVDLPRAIVGWLKGRKSDSEILSPKIGIVGQKDIELVQLPIKISV